MTSRKLFLADCIENFKRRNWVFWLQFLAFFFYFPGALLLGLNSIWQSYEDNPALMMKHLYEYTQEILGISTWAGVVIVGLAVLAGIQAFSWLHHKQQVNFYHSQPVSRNRRFLVIWFNGIISFLVCYIFNLLLGMVVAASYGCLSEEIMAAIPQAFLAHLLLFLAIYHVAVVAVMLTGHTLVSLLGVTVLLVYEIAIRGLCSILAFGFFLTYNNRENEKIVNTLFSPIITFFRYSSTQQYGNSHNYGAERITYSETMFTMAGLALFFGLLGWLLYKARASESHEKSISFPKLKEPLKVLLLLVFGLAGGLFIYLVSGSSDVFGIGGAIFVTVIGHAVIQLIYEVDFRAIKKGLASLGLSVVLVIFIFAAFRWDILGYDEWIPKQEKVESVAISLESDYWNNNRILSDGTDVDAGYYWQTEMELTDLDMVYRLLDNRVNEENFTDYEELYRLDVVFNLKNGKSSYRTCFFSYEDNLEVMNEIFHTPEYQKTTNQLMEDHFAEQFNIFEMEYDNGHMDYAVPADEIRLLLDAYVKDVNNISFAEIKHSIPIGKLTVRGRGIQDKEYINQWEVIIYPGFTNTVSLLKQCGISTEAVCDQEYLERIKTITITYTDVEALEASGQPMVSEYRGDIIFVNQAFAENFNKDMYGEVEAVYYVEPAKLKEILDNAYLDEIAYWSRYGGSKIRGDVDINAALYHFGHMGDEDYIYHDYYFFEEGKLPEFVKKAIEEALGK